jgi:hypothetical protein
MSFDFGTTTQLLADAQSIFTGVQAYVYLAIGIPLAFYLGRKLIGLIPKK